MNNEVYGNQLNKSTLKRDYRFLTETWKWTLYVPVLLLIRFFETKWMLISISDSDIGFSSVDKTDMLFHFSCINYKFNIYQGNSTLNLYLDCENKQWRKLLKVLGIYFGA